MIRLHPRELFADAEIAGQQLHFFQVLVHRFSALILQILRSQPAF
jgi:hypothetical protein